MPSNYSKAAIAQSVDLNRIANLPDSAILSKREVSVLLGIGIGTLDNMANRGDGPPRIQISKRRVGYRLGNVRRWDFRRLAA
jgi:predicted DNA-binding transcriptional regulator AlpA